MRVAEINYNRFHWKILLFASRRNMHRWIARNIDNIHPDSDAMTVTWKRDGTDNDRIATMLFCDGHLGIEILSHEAVHMARSLLRRTHQLRNEGAWAYSVGELTRYLTPAGLPFRSETLVS